MSDSEGAADHVALVTGHVRQLGVCNTSTLTDSHHYNNVISLVHTHSLTSLQ